MRRTMLVATLIAAALSSTDTALARADAATFVVVFEDGASVRSAHHAVARAGGRIVTENRAVGVATVRASSRRFAVRARHQRAVMGVARNVRIGRAPRRPDHVEGFRGGAAAGTLRAPKIIRSAPPAEPLASLQWNMRMIGATVNGSYARQRGSHAVRVGILDSGIDATHPDIAPNFDRALSRNFTVDDPLIDGPCEDEPDRSCDDPPDVDEQGHGTHVAGIVAAALNGRGVAGVAPGVDLVNLRVSQESGFVFLQPVVDALTFAGDHGIDVVNMSFWVDHWWLNCTNNPADTPEQQAMQRVTLESVQRAIDYARARGVTTISSLGNEHTDLSHPTVDDISPTYPPGSAHHRDVDNQCESMPVEAAGVIGVSALGPSGRKAYYSNYGVERTDLSAPGGDRREFFGTPRYDAPENRVLSSFPASVGREAGLIGPDGTPTTPLIVRDGDAYYFWAQGTSMAAPHATGAAALIIAEQGAPDRRHGGLTMDPASVARVLTGSATNTACPSPPTLVYPDPDLTPDFSATCEGGRRFNGFYGNGIVNALGFDQ